MTSEQTTFDPYSHLEKIKGGALYLKVMYRLIWLTEDCKSRNVEFEVKSEMVHLDLKEKIAVHRCEVYVPGIGRATDYGSETEKDFPAGWIEKSATKALGRALAQLGYGTQFAIEFDEGERVVDSPARPTTKVSTDDLRREVAAGLATDKDAASKLPKPADEMNAEELAKTLSWLRNRAGR